MVSTASNLQEQDRIISAIESASDAELSALADISNLLQKINSGNDGLIISRPSRTPPADRTPQHNALGLKLVEKKRASNKNKNEPQKEPIKNPNETQKYSETKREAKRSQIEIDSGSNRSQKKPVSTKNEFNDDSIPNSVSFKSYLRNKKALNGGEKNNASMAAESITAEIKPHPVSSLRNNRGGGIERLRTASGRFASKDKNESIDAKKNSANDRKANEKMQAGFLHRLGGVIGDSTKSLAESGNDSALDVAGSTGGSFWKAGKEAAGIISNAKDNVVSLHDWVQGKREEIKPAAKQATVKTPSIQPPIMGGTKETTSAKEFASQGKNAQTKAIKEQTKLAQTNDEKVISLLEDILKKNKGGGGGSGILGKILGAMGITAIGKKIGGKLGAAILAALGIKKIKGLLSGSTGSSGGNIDIEGGRDSNRKNKKNKNHKRNQAKPKKTSGLRRFVKGKNIAKVTAGAVAAGGAAYAGKKALESAGENVAKKTAVKEIEKGAAKTASQSVEKTAGKAATKATEKTIETTASKSAEKLAEKGAAKATGKLALKAVPIVGTAIGAGIDAYDGFSDTDAQRETFGLKEGEEVSTRHKSEYALANIADMGGLVSGGAGLLASGAKWLGMDSAADALTFDTGDIAKSIDSKVSGVIGLFSSDSKKIAENADEGADERNKTLIDTVKKGATDTVDVINKLVISGVSAFAGAIGIGDVKAPVATAAGEMQLNTMAGKFSSLEQQYGLPAGLLRGVATTESQGENGARSSAGAKGMFQFMPKTAAEYGLVGEDVYDPDKSAAAAAKKLGGLVKQYNGDVGLALSAYNWGEGNIQRNGMAAAPKETREYAPKVFAAMQAAGATVPSTSITYTKEQKVTEPTLNTPTTSTEVPSTPKATEPASKTPVVQSNAPPSTPANLPTALATVAPLASKAKFDESKNKPQPEKAKDSSGSTGFWATLKKARDAADNKIAGYAENVQGVRAIRPDAGLTLPKNVSASDLPAGLQMAMLPANQIAQATKTKRIENRAHTAVTQPEIYSGKSTPVPAPVTHKAGGVIPASDLNRELPADYQAPQPAKQTGSFSQTLADIVLPSAADTFKSMTQGFTSGGMLDGAMSDMGLNNSQARAFAPLTGFMTKNIDSGVNGMTDSVTNAIRQPTSLAMPRTLPTVTDLAASGVKTPVTRDKSTSTNDNAMLVQLQKIATSIDKLLGVQKEANNKGKDPNTTSNSSQPAPRNDIPLGSSVDALSQMLSDRN
ncbi:transglycosylase SLT domain-containing protein [Yersinia ruckeri]|uniref:lytic transglycosylase domain-containing protein n=1 Tax=Yersinia ruckeri TaxID=29486 RepID=UPI0020BF290D|nr:transglycosylase SLT domain-containing protein [Yersinia ruckeri]MCK8586593.1 transglycosylase SLT domain-containing protein [Yersinia ruckeri]